MANAAARAVEAIRERLAEQTWVAGDRLPSEPTLAEQVGVSRVSIRSALAQLESEGLVSRRHGSGTYVNSVRPLVRSLHHNVGSDQLISSRGHVPGIAQMTWRETVADDEVASRLGMEAGTPVIELFRVRTSDGEPVTIEQDWFPMSLLPPEPVNLGSSLYAFLSSVCGVEITFGIATLEPSRVGPDNATVFGVSEEELCLIIRQVDYDTDESPVSYSVEHHLARAFDFQLVRQGPSTSATRSRTMPTQS